MKLKRWAKRTGIRIVVAVGGLGGAYWYAISPQPLFCAPGVRRGAAKPSRHPFLDESMGRGASTLREGHWIVYRSTPAS